MKIYPSTIVIKSTSLYTRREEKSNSTYSGLAEVLLFIAVVSSYKGDIATPMDDKFIDTLRCTKNNITKKGNSNYHDSTGCNTQLGIEVHLRNFTIHLLDSTPI